MKHVRSVSYRSILAMFIVWTFIGSLVFFPQTPLQAASNEACRPDGMYKTPGIDTPYCDIYDTTGREKMGADHPRRIIGYFPSWRTGKNGQPAYLVHDIPWDNITHINYAFAHIDAAHKISVGPNSPDNASTGMTWPNVAGAEMDPTLSYQGHFNLLTQYKRQHPNVRTFISVGGWAETGGHFAPDGSRVNDGGFYTLTDNQANIDTFADSVVTFLRTYGFDGVDIDYEYPTSMKDAGNPADWGFANARRAQLMNGYIALMKTLREKLDAAGAADGNYYMLTIAAPSSGYLLRGMEVYQVTPYLDYVNVMTYDLHGAWNEYVGPNAALYDDGKDAELIRWNVYGTSQYGGIGYLNTDWSYHYFRGALPAGRINIGVPYYTRGWKNVSGGTNGLWGTAVGSNCPTGLTSCGNGATGIDNIWHDKDEQGQEIGAGANPMWHAKNLEAGIYPSYGSQFGLTPSDLTGNYVRNYDSALVAPWLWNAQKKVFLSTEDEQSLGVKANYVIDEGIGGIMFWELSGDYDWDSTKNEYFMGDTLTSLLYSRFQNATPYENTRANRAMPHDQLDVKIDYTDWPIGDSNFPISPKVVIKNNSTTTIPGGAVFEFDYATSAPANAKDQSGFGLQIVEVGHTGNNIGGLDGDYHRVRFTLPSWQSIAPGANISFDFVYYLPVSTPSNWTITFGGKSYGLTTEYRRGTIPNVTQVPATATPVKTATPVNPTATPVNPTATPVNPTATPVNPTATPVPPTATPVIGGCTAPAWLSSKIYVGNDRVSHNGHEWRAKWWTQNEQPGVTTSGVWEDLGLCSGQPTATPSNPTATPIKTATPVNPTATPVNPTATNVPPTATPNTGVQAWQAGISYSAGQKVTYNGLTYSCRQPHTSMTGWEPPNVPALWLQN